MLATISDIQPLLRAYLQAKPKILAWNKQLLDYFKLQDREFWDRLEVFYIENREASKMLEFLSVDLKDVKIKYFEDHHSCIHQMMIGSAAACFTGIQSARLYEAKTGAKLRTIARSPSIPQTLFVVHSRVPWKDRETIRRTLLTSTLQGLAPELREFISRDAQQPFIPAEDSDYDIVRQYWSLLEGRQ